MHHPSSSSSSSSSSYYSCYRRLVWHETWPLHLASYLSCSPSLLKRFMYHVSSIQSGHSKFDAALCSVLVPKCSGCKAITAANCTHFKPFVWIKLQFFCSFWPWSQGACWFGVCTHAIEGWSPHKISLDSNGLLMCRAALSYQRGAWAFCANVLMGREPF